MDTDFVMNLEPANVMLIGIAMQIALVNKTIYKITARPSDLYALVLVQKLCKNYIFITEVIHT